MGALQRHLAHLGTTIGNFWLQVVSMTRFQNESFVKSKWFAEEVLSFSDECGTFSGMEFPSLQQVSTTRTQPWFM